MAVRTYGPDDLLDDGDTLRSLARGGRIILMRVLDMNSPRCFAQVISEDDLIVEYDIDE